MTNPNPEQLNPRRTVTIDIEGQPTECHLRNQDSFNFKSIDSLYLIKTQPSIITFAKGGEVISTGREGMSVTAKPGQAIVRNVNAAGQTEDAYIYGNPDDTVEQQLAMFHSKYQPHQPTEATAKIPLKPDQQLFSKKLDFTRAIQVTEPTAIHQGWNPEAPLMGVLAGGVVTEQGYTVHPDSLASFYKIVDFDTFAQLISQMESN